MPEKGQFKFMQASGVALIKLGLETIALLAIAVASIRAMTSARRETARGSRNAVMPIMGRSLVMPPPPPQAERPSQAVTSRTD